MRRFVVDMADRRTRWAITPEALVKLRAALPPGWELQNIGAQTASTGDGSGVSEEALEAVRGAEIYAGFGFPRELFDAATAVGSHLRWVHTGAAGVASLLYPELISADVIITNSAGTHAPPMAETVIAMALHFARGVDFATRNQARSVWDQGAFQSADSPVVELHGRRLGLLGYGGIGREVGWRARALGMHVMATRRHAHKQEPDVEILPGTAAGIERVLRASDVVVIAMPDTPETRGSIAARELAFMKPDAVLINVARGAIVDEAALIDVLQRGAIRGAGLDVFAREPLADDSPLWQLPNTLILPHVSGTTERFWQREVDLILDNLRRYLRGETLRNVVNKSLGY